MTLRGASNQPGPGSDNYVSTAPDQGLTAEQQQNALTNLGIKAQINTANGHRMALEGDSRTFTNFQYPGSESSPRYRDNGWFNQANALAGNPFELVLNNAVSGSTTADVLARAPALAARTDIDAICLWIGINNSMTTSGNLATAISELGQILDLYLTAGHYVYMLTETTKTGAATAVYQNFLAYNSWMRDYARANSGKMRVIETYPTIVDPTSATAQPQTDVLYDGLHPSVQGAFQMGEVICPNFSDLPPLYALVESVLDCRGNNPVSTNLFDYGLMQGTGGSRDGNTTGSVPDGWSALKAAGTGTANIEILPEDNGVGNKVRITLTSTGSGCTYQFKALTSIHSRLTDGVNVNARAVIRAINPAYLHECSFKVAKTTGDISSLNAVGSTGIYTGSFVRTHITPWYEIPVGGETNFLPSVTINTNGAGVTIIEVSRVSVIEEVTV